MKAGDIVRINEDNIEYNYLKRYSLVALIVVEEDQEDGYNVALSVPNFSMGHGADRYDRDDCWWTSKKGLEVIEEF